MVYIVHKQLPSFALGLHEVSADGPVVKHQDTLDIGVWNEDDWSATRERMESLGFAPEAHKLTNPHQKWADYRDPDGYLIRFSYTRPPVTQQRMDPNTRDFED